MHAVCRGPAATQPLRATTSEVDNTQQVLSVPDQGVMHSFSTALAAWPAAEGQHRLPQTRLSHKLHSAG